MRTFLKPLLMYAVASLLTLASVKQAFADNSDPVLPARTVAVAGLSDGSRIVVQEKIFYSEGNVDAREVTTYKLSEDGTPISVRIGRRSYDENGEVSSTSSETYVFQDSFFQATFLDVNEQFGADKDVIIGWLDDDYTAREYYHIALGYGDWAEGSFYAYYKNGLPFDKRDRKKLLGQFRPQG